MAINFYLYTVQFIVDIFPHLLINLYCTFSFLNNIIK